MKKILLPLILLAGMTLVGCGGGGSPEPKPEEGYGVAITNKTELQAQWYAGEASRDLAIDLTPAGNVMQELTKKTLTVASNNDSVVKVQGISLHALAKGTAEITVTYHGWKDKVSLSIDKMPTVQEKYGVTHSGTSADPLTNEEALTVAKHADYAKYKDDLYVGGKVASFYHAPGARDDGAVSWFLEPAEGQTEKFEIYKCYKTVSGKQANLTDDDVWVGGYAVAHGKFTSYKGQYETDGAIFDRCEGTKPAPRTTIAATFAEALAAGAKLADGADTYDYYKFDAFVTAKEGDNYFLTASKGEELVKAKSDAQHGEKDYYSNAIEIYNVSGADLLAKLKKDAKITVKMIIKNYHAQVENLLALAAADVTVLEEGTDWPTPVPPTPTKTWKKIDAQPTVGGDYKLILNREDNASNPGLWFLKDQTEAEAKDGGKEYYITTSQAETDAATITLIAAEGGFKVKIGARYLWIGLVGTHTNSLLKATEAEASVLTYDLTNGFGVTLSEAFWGLGTRNDRSFTTAGAVNLTQYPANYKVCLYVEDSEPVPSGSWDKITAQPTVGGDYKLILNREDNASNPGLWFLKDQTEAEAKDGGKEYYITTSQAETDAATITLIAAEGGFKVKIGARYLWIGLVGTHTNSLLKATEAEASVLTYDLTNGFGVTLSEAFWGLGTRNDRSFTTAGAVNLTQYPANYKVCLYQYNEAA